MKNYEQSLGANFLSARHELEEKERQRLLEIMEPMVEDLMVSDPEAAETSNTAVPRNPSGVFQCGNVLVFPAGTEMKNLMNETIKTEEPMTLEVEFVEYRYVKMRELSTVGYAPFEIKKRDVPVVLPLKANSRLSFQSEPNDHPTNVECNKNGLDTKIKRELLGILKNKVGDEKYVLDYKGVQFFLDFDFESRNVMLCADLHVKDKRDTNRGELFGKIEVVELTLLGNINEAGELIRNQEDATIKELSSSSVNILFEKAISSKPEIMADVKYERRSENIRTLMAIEEKNKNKEQLSDKDLIFLYKVADMIPGLRYDDPRIAQIISVRNKKEDAPIALKCEPGEIAWGKEEVNEHTKAYIGGLFPDVFSLNIEHVYTSFPDRKIERGKIKIGGMEKEELKQQLKNRKLDILFSEDMLNNEEFVTLGQEKEMEYVLLEVEDFNVSGKITTKDIYQKAEEFGLEFCPAELAIHLCLKQKMEYAIVAMEEISESVFTIESWPRGLGSREDVKPDKDWKGAEVRFVFCCRHNKNNNESISL